MRDGAVRVGASYVRLKTSHRLSGCEVLGCVETFALATLKATFASLQMPAWPCSSCRQADSQSRLPHNLPCPCPTPWCQSLMPHCVATPGLTACTTCHDASIRRGTTSPRPHNLDATLRRRARSQAVAFLNPGPSGKCRAACNPEHMRASTRTHALASRRQAACRLHERRR
eukprot:232484-Chlamydomonas_euryale.AAC.8